MIALRSLTGANHAARPAASLAPRLCYTVCVLMTEGFLEFSRFRGNDLSLPLRSMVFPA